ncbi:MAG: hypothetical protein WAM66_12805 [Acidobacteriaceae bacterium]
MVVIRQPDGGGAMQVTRRRMVTAMTGAAAALAVARLSGGQSRAASPQPMPSPNAPTNQNVPAGLDGANIPVNNGRNVVPPATWLEIRKDARKLLDMAADFNKRVDATNLSSTLPLVLIHEANRIEKLAKKIQNRMKG